MQSVLGHVVAEAGEEPVESGSVCGAELGGLMLPGVRWPLSPIADEAAAAEDE